MTEPLTVLMAVRNGEPYLRTAVESILAQSYREFRFLIIDDASTDRTRDIVRAYADSRIELLALEQNVGQTAALNVGVRCSASPWIARMDADDYSAPTRLAAQMNALAHRPAVRCVGTGVWEFRDDPMVVDVAKTRPLDYAGIQRAALCGSGLIHGSIVIHRESLLDAGAYDERYRYASDREMFIRFLNRYEAMNLAEPLFGIRRHPHQDSFSLRAADEYLEIFDRLIASGDYEPEEIGILRESLAFSYLFRGRCFRAKGRYQDWCRDVARAVRISPTLVARHALGTLAVRVLPRRRHMTIRVGTNA